MGGGGGGGGGGLGVSKKSVGGRGQTKTCWLTKPIYTKGVPLRNER